MAPKATHFPTVPFRKLFWGPSVRDCKNHQAPKVEEKVEKAPTCTPMANCPHRHLLWEQPCSSSLHRWWAQSNKTRFLCWKQPSKGAKIVPVPQREALSPVRSSFVPKKRWVGCAWQWVRSLPHPHTWGYSSVRCGWRGAAGGIRRER